MNNKFFIVSGMSGAGKSQALKVFEDFEFTCIDNMPLSMIESFADLWVKNKKTYKNVAISIDARAGKELGGFNKILNILKKKKINYKIIFLNSADSVLIRRYSETRRKHPLGKSVVDGIELERKMLSGIFTIADEIIDTSDMTIGALKETISKFAGRAVLSKEHLDISLVSFGYKYGIPNDADIVYDVRFITNPNYIHGLKLKTGKDKAVQNYILKQKDFRSFFNLFAKLILQTLPGYIKEGKSYLTIAVGCTGGRHRSVFTVEKLNAFLKSKKYKVKTNHRDILRTR